MAWHGNLVVIVFHSLNMLNLNQNEQNFVDFNLKVFLDHDVPVSQNCKSMFSPSAAYMHQWTGQTLVQVMAWRLNQHWLIASRTLWNKLKWNSNQNTKIFIHENAYENVCEMSKGRGVKWWFGDKPMPEPMMTRFSDGCVPHLGTLLLTGWDKIMYPFPNYNGCTINVSK